MLRVVHCFSEGPSSLKATRVTAAAVMMMIVMFMV